MTSPRNNQTNFGAKFLLTSLSLTMVLGFWNLFSKKAGQSNIENNQSSPVTELWTDSDPNFTALPTLVPLVWTLSDTNSDQLSSDEPGVPIIIREVSAPTQQPTSQQQAPIVESISTTGQQQEQPTTAQQPQAQPTAVTTTGSSK